MNVRQQDAPRPRPNQLKVGVANAQLLGPKPAMCCVLNWRADGLPKEANKIRPRVIVEDTDLFAEEHPNVIVVPLTTSASTIVSQLAVTTAPTRENGLERTSFAPTYMVTAASKQHVQHEPIGTSNAGQLHSMRAYIAESLGIRHNVEKRVDRIGDHRGASQSAARPAIRESACLTRTLPIARSLYRGFDFEPLREGSNRMIVATKTIIAAIECPACALELLCTHSTHRFSRRARRRFRGRADRTREARQIGVRNHTQRPLRVTHDGNYVPERLS
jgi:mRNA interferase MazF